MKTIMSVCLLAVITIACDKSPTSSSSEVTAASKPASPSGAATTAAAAPAAAPKAAFVQKGIGDGKVIVGHIQDANDASQCAAVTDKPEKKEEFKKNGEKFAEMVKGKLVDSCPTDHVVGTCNVGFGLLNNYSGPKWTAETAKAECAKSKGKWVD